MPSFLKSKNIREITEMLILVLILAPVPGGHCHSDCDSIISSQQLTLHFQIYHGGPDNAGNWPEGWHLHWGFPANGESLKCCDATVFGGEIMLFSCVHDPLDGLEVSHLNSWKFWRFFCHESVPDERQHSFLTVALLHSRQSLPELLGIMRC